MAFVQLLFQREPETLRCQEEEREQLEVRANDLQQTALQQEVTSQVKLQVCWLLLIVWSKHTRVF